MHKIPTPLITHFSSFYILSAFCIRLSEFLLFLGFLRIYSYILMELRLELALSSWSGNGSEPNQECRKRQKRSFDEAFMGLNKNVQSHRIEDEVGGGGLVGWPPVKSWRKQLFSHQYRRACATNYVNVTNGGGGGRWRNSMYVKVKMEGDGIARKVDLRAHCSYQTLMAKLIALFGKCEENVEMYKLTYQDKEGNWLAAGVVPWETFILSVQRMKLQKNRH